MCKYILKYEIQRDALTSQAFQGGNNLGMLSIAQTFKYTHSNQLAELPSVDGLISILQQCREHKDLVLAKHVHARICDIGLESHKDVGNYIVPMFVECGSLSAAQEGFKRLPFRNVYSWTSLMLGYTHCEKWQHALDLYHEMKEERVHPSSYTLMSLLKACAGSKDAEKGQEIHVEIAQMGHERCLYVGSALVDMYAKCGLLSEAREVIDKLPVRNVVSWNALISGYAEHGPSQEAMKCFKQMQMDNVAPDTITFICILKACSSVGAIVKGREIHMEFAKEGTERNPFAGNILVDMYAKCGFLTEARRVFDKLPVRDSVSWTALIAGYAEHGPGQEALNCFEELQLEEVSLDAAIFACALKTCGSIGAIAKGGELHRVLIQKGLENNLHIGSTLVDMYAKCGHLAEAQKVLDKLPERSVVSWNAMINGYGINDESNLAVKAFENMRDEGVKPDAITFLGLLTACSRASLVLKGQEFLKMMRDDYGIAPTVGHCMCMVDLFARSGRLCDAGKFLETLPCSPSKDMWTALLSACKTYEEAEVGQRCFHQLVQMGSDLAAPYVLMGNLYSSAGRWNDARRIEEQRKQAGAKNLPASAWIEVNKKVHEFVAGNNQCKKITGMLELMSSRMEGSGLVPKLDVVLRPISDGRKKAALCQHAEKLAIAFGLLNTPQGQTLLVTKNMRMCNDCHNTAKVISKIKRREIIVRDVYRVHHFKGGLCSCKDFS